MIPLGVFGILYLPSSIFVTGDITATVKNILENENIDEETRAIFSDELAYLRGETQYQDCDGNLNSGNCVGEADLFKAASLLLTLFEKVVDQ